MKLETEIHIGKLLARMWLVPVFVLMIVSQSALAAISEHSSEHLSSPSLEFPGSLLQSVESTQKASNGLIICEESQEESSDCCVHCCSCQMYLYIESPTLMISNDTSIYPSKISNVFLEGLISVPFRPPRTASSIGYKQI